jgi:hypothetical protein
VSFVVGTVLFVVVLGLLDRRLPWPAPRDEAAVRDPRR